MLAGVNGAGKSSVVGEALRQQGGEYFNPDEVAQKLRRADSALGQEQANAQAWRLGTAALERAIAERKEFTLETTLGGKTIRDLLIRAADERLEVVVIYVGLDSADRHVARVAARVKQGGHDIPEARSRERYVSSRENLVRLVPHLTELVVWDNSDEGDPAAGVAPRPRRLLHHRRRTITEVAPLETIPDWAKPIVMAVKRKVDEPAA